MPRVRPCLLNAGFVNGINVACKHLAQVAVVVKAVRRIRELPRAQQLAVVVAALVSDLRRRKAPPSTYLSRPPPSHELSNLADGGHCRPSPRADLVRHGETEEAPRGANVPLVGLELLVPFHPYTFLLGRERPRRLQKPRL